VLVREKAPGSLDHALEELNVMLLQQRFDRGVVVDVACQAVNLVYEQDVGVPLGISDAAEEPLETGPLSGLGGGTRFDELLDDEPVMLMSVRAHGFQLGWNR
jgi:hypothetical protein